MKRTRMRRRFKSTSYARRERDLPRMAWCKTLPCALVDGAATLPEWVGRRPDPCAREIEAHHAGVHGLSNKAPDDTCVPLCDHHHDALTDRTGIFAGWPRYTLKLWELAAVAVYQVRYAAHLARGAVGDLF